MTKHYDILIADKAKWDRKKRDYVGPTEKKTFAQIRAEIDAACERARAIHAQHRAQLSR